MSSAYFFKATTKLEAVDTKALVLHSTLLTWLHDNSFGGEECSV